MYIIEVMKDIKWKLCELSHQKYYRYSESQFTKELKKWYAKNLDQELDLDNPRTFNGKIQWLKLFDSTPEKACLADKLRCRQWVEQRIGSQYLIPLIGGSTGYLMELIF